VNERNTGKGLEGGRGKKDQGIIKGTGWKRRELGIIWNLLRIFRLWELGQKHLASFLEVQIL
jgi:hypothetical protein